MAPHYDAHYASRRSACRLSASPRHIISKQSPPPQIGPTGRTRSSAHLIRLCGHIEETPQLVILADEYNSSHRIMPEYQTSGPSSALTAPSSPASSLPRRATIISFALSRTGFSQYATAQVIVPARRRLRHGQAATHAQH
jgi:hypothetical protein